MPESLAVFYVHILIIICLMDVKTCASPRCKCSHPSNRSLLPNDSIVRNVPYVHHIKQKTVLNNYPSQLWRAVQLAVVSIRMLPANARLLFPPSGR